MSTKSRTTSPVMRENGAVRAEVDPKDLFQFKIAGQNRKYPLSDVKGLSVALYSVACLVSYIIAISLIIIVLPLLVFCNLLRYIERKIIFMTSRSEALSGEDAFWQQETPWNRTIINGMVVVEGEVQTNEFRDIMLERGVYCKNKDGTLKFPRFTHCIRKGYFQYFWVKENAFNIDEHVLKWERDIPSSKSHLQEVVSEIISKPLPDNISPWQAIVIPTNFDKGDTVVVVRLSHSIADGVSLTRFFIHQLPDESPKEKEPVKFSMQRKISMMVKAILVAPAILLDKLFLRSDISILHGPQLAGTKKVAWTESIELNLIKSIKNKTGTTVNDVLMTCMTMALRNYFIDKSAPIPAHFTSCVPVDVRPRGESLEFMNRFAVVFLRLPTGVNDPLSQLIATKENMDVIKTSGEPIVLSSVMHYGVELFPEWFVRPVASNMTSKSSCVLSNVPGPQTSLVLKGHKVKFMTFWPPQRDNIGIALSIYSYSGQVFVGVEGDVAILPDPTKIADIFKTKVIELAEIVDQL